MLRTLLYRTAGIDLYLLMHLFGCCRLLLGCQSGVVRVGSRKGLAKTNPPSLLRLRRKASYDIRTVPLMLNEGLSSGDNPCWFLWLDLGSASASPLDANARRIRSSEGSLVRTVSSQDLVSPDSHDTLLIDSFEGGLMKEACRLDRRG